MVSQAIAAEDIRRAIAALPNTVRQEAKENFVLLSVMTRRSGRGG